MTCLTLPMRAVRSRVCRLRLLATPQTNPNPRKGRQPMTDPEAHPPKRRLHLALDMDADDLEELSGALRTLANDLFYEGIEQREQTSGGWSTGHHLVLTLTDETMDGDTYRRRLAEWIAERKTAQVDR